MEDQTAQIIGAIVVIAIIIGLIKGAIKTFQRNWIAALILLILLTPIWVIWAFIELFTGEIVASAAQPNANTQSVNVTLVNQADGTTRQLKDLSSDQLTETVEARQIKEPPLTSSYVSDAQVEDETKECPFCAEKIRKNAVICRYCNRDL
jgi:apolipoprotein N-acyltransferase